MNYENNNIIKFSFWIDKLTKYPEKLSKHPRAQIKRISWDLTSIKTNKSNLHLNTIESMNYENNEGIIPSFDWEDNKNALQKEKIHLFVRPEILPILLYHKGKPEI